MGAKTYKWDMVWSNTILLGFMHALAVYGYFNRYEAKWQTIVYAKIIGLVSLIGVTGGAHRLWAHRSYKANTACQILLATMMTMTYQNSIYTWCRDHRLHHKFSETDADPHNAKRGFFFSHMGWLMVRKQEDVKIKGKTIDMSDLKANKVVMFQHKYYYFLVIPGTFLIPSFVPWYFWKEQLYVSVLSAVTSYIISVNLTWCINSLAHLYGIKPYDRNIGPVENLVMKLIGLGEGFHNYHHTFPQDYRASEYGSEGRNLTATFIDFLAKIGWVTERNTTSTEIISKRIARTGDGNIVKNAKMNNFVSYAIFVIFVMIL